MRHWTKEMDYGLAFGTAMGLSAAQIAFQMKDLGITRNAVIGRWNRTGMFVPLKRGGPRQGRTIHMAYYPRLQRYSQDDDDIIVRMFEEGKTDDEIGAAIGRSAPAIRNRRTSLRAVRERTPAWSPEEIRSLTDMLAKGHTMAEVALAMRRSYQGVNGKIKALGLKGRRSIRRFTKEEDDLIRLEYSKYTPTDDIAKKIGRSPGMARSRIFQLGLRRDGRKSRLANRFGFEALTLSDDPDEIRRIFSEMEKEKRERAKAEFKAKVDHALDLMTEAIENGEDRQIAMQAAMVSGATLQQVGDRVGLTRERIRQIVHKIYVGQPRTEEERTTCGICGKHYTPHWMSQKYCSLECRAEALSKRRRPFSGMYSAKETECPECHTTFVKNHPQRIYCGNRCSALVQARRQQEGYSRKNGNKKIKVHMKKVTLAKDHSTEAKTQPYSLRKHRYD